jgi:hypothetical protein
MNNPQGKAAIPHTDLCQNNLYQKIELRDRSETATRGSSLIKNLD